MSEHGIRWACEYCTYENWPSAIKCTMCRAQSPSGTIITEDPFKSSSSDVGRDWDPSGTEGGSSPLICPDSSARPRVKSSYSMENANKWSCHMCTYLNWPRAISAYPNVGPGVPQNLLNPQDLVQDQLLFVAVDPCEEYNDRRNHPLVTQMVEKWLDRYRQIRPCTSLSDGEEDEDEEEE